MKKLPVFAEGRAKARQEIAENALRENFPLELIAELMGLNETEVAALRAKIAPLDALGYVGGESDH